MGDRYTIDNVCALERRHCVVLLVIPLLFASPFPLGASVYDEPLYDVCITADAVYGIGVVNEGASTVDLVSDLYEPIGCGQVLKPVLVTIHGGGFITGDKTADEHVALALYFATRGFAVVSINYRLGRDEPPADPEQVAAAAAYRMLFGAADLAAAHAAIVDTKTALRWVHANAEIYGFDTNRVFVSGDSAGEFCAVIAAITEPAALCTDLPGEAIPEMNHPTADCDVQAAVNLWGGAGPWLDALDAVDPPMMLVYGSEDWLLEEGERLCSRCNAIGATFEWVLLDGWGHSTWDAKIAGQSIPAAILEFLTRRRLLTL